MWQLGEARGSLLWLPSCLVSVKIWENRAFPSEVSCSVSLGAWRKQTPSTRWAPRTPQYTASWIFFFFLFFFWHVFLKWGLIGRWVKETGASLLWQPFFAADCRFHIYICVNHRYQGTQRFLRVWIIISLTGCFYLFQFFLFLFKTFLNSGRRITVNERGHHRQSEGGL